MNLVYRISLRRPKKIYQDYGGSFKPLLDRNLPATSRHRGINPNPSPRGEAVTAILNDHAHMNIYANGINILIEQQAPCWMVMMKEG
jgi:hypothetical protein